MSADPAKLQSFVTFCQSTFKGDEKKEAQSFLDRFFKAFGHEGAIEAGAEFETTLSKSSKKGKTGFADLVWRSRPGTPGVVIEMKSRGEDLNKHYAQVERYWMRITPNRPRYAMLCNFDQFWIFDFENQVDEPVDKIPLEKLPERAGALSFMVLGGTKPVFKNNQVEVTDRTARRMGELYQIIYERGKKTDFRDFSEEQLQRFILQGVLAMFAEDRKLLPQDLFVRLIQDCLDGKGSTYDILAGLFQEMNRKGVTPAGRYKGVDYFNGGLFAIVDPIDLTEPELKLLDVCARDDWSNVRPSIFGNIFEGAIDPVKRHAHGIHFTSEVDIRQIVRPTISDYWEDQIDAAGTIGELNDLQLKLQSYRVLDPACGSGNFLYVAYQELKRLEKLLIDRIAERRRSDSGQMAIGYVTPLQFFGMDTNPFAVQLARVTMMIGRKIAIDRLGLFEPALPLDTLDKNIVCKDALFSDWEPADAVIGNPPFLGGSRIRSALGDTYVERLYAKFPEVKDQVDFCTYWFRLTHDQLQKNSRAGLVATKSIRESKSRVAALDYITQNQGCIHEAISTQPWSGEANVYVSLVNWSKQIQKKCFLDFKEVQKINSSLTAGVDVVTQAVKLKVNLYKCFEGAKPTGKGFIISERQVQDWIQSDTKNKAVLKLFSMGSNLAKNPHGLPNRWIVDFDDRGIEEASEFKLPFEHIKQTVKPERDKNRRESRRLRWWRYGENAPKMRKATATLTKLFVVPRVSKWAAFIVVPPGWLLGEKTVVVASDDFCIFGILSSNIHRRWMNAQKSTLGETTAYTPTTCFETFPFPQTPDKKLVEQIRSTAQELHQYRTEIMEKKQWGITRLYNQFFHEPASQLYKLHAKLDDLVMKAYGFKTGDDLLEKLLELNLKLAEKEKRGEPIVGPWSPVD